jgi:hypothetical protein
MQNPPIIAKKCRFPECKDVKEAATAQLHAGWGPSPRGSTRLQGLTPNKQVALKKQKAGIESNLSQPLL